MINSHNNLRHSVYEIKVLVINYLKFGTKFCIFYFCKSIAMSIQNLFQSFLLHLPSVIVTHLGDVMEAFPTIILKTGNKLATVKS